MQLMNRNNCRHKEAFCLMTYADAEGNTEILWNSRDGVTPMFITGRDGKTEMKHVDWHKDMFAPHHTPKPNDRIFVDATPELLRDKAADYVNRCWDDPHMAMKDYESFQGMTKDQVVGHMLEIWCEPGSPTIKTVQVGEDCSHRE